jgi:pyruvate/2-oxoglutarate dehydrogenase complex dihydrolipoamide acyltransferase (E2) component
MTNQPPLPGQPPPGWTPPQPPGWPGSPPPGAGSGPPSAPPKTPWWRRTWVVALVALLVGFGIGAAAGGGSQADTTASADTPTATTTITESQTAAPTTTVTETPPAPTATETETVKVTPNPRPPFQPMGSGLSGPTSNPGHTGRPTTAVATGRACRTCPAAASSPMGSAPTRSSPFPHRTRRSRRKIAVTGHASPKRKLPGGVVSETG